jgi:tetratricopeptide (TPR) repeat protein
MFRSSGDPEAAFPLFRSAFERALEAGEHYLAGDAAHMCAIAVSDREAMEEWTERGLELGEQEPEAEYLAGPLLNNLGWHYYEAGEYEHALQLFQRALEVRERDPANQAAIAHAREAIETALQARG